MSTRGTYRFQNDMEDVTIYVHHDNYPVGGAIYLYATLVKPSKGGMGTQFIRAIDGAEITSCHTDHGDTEFRYDIEGDGPAAKLTVRGCCYDQWRVVFSGPIHEFLAREFQKWMPDWGQGHADCDYCEFREVKSRYGTRPQWHNAVTAKQCLDREYGPLDHLRKWAEGGIDRNSGNYKSCVAEVQAFLDVFPGLWTQEIEQLTGIAIAV